MSTSKKEGQQDANVLFNRVSVALARQQRLLASMLQSADKSEEPPTKKQKPERNPDVDLTDEFRGETDAGGIGSKRQYDDDELPEGALRPKTSGANDKLLEQILGKKGAAQHRKAQKTVGREDSVSTQSTPKPAADALGKRKVEVESDEEDGRAAAFKGKKAKKAKDEPKTEEVKSEPGKEQDGQEETLRLGEPAVPKREKPVGKPKPMSYLDELLAKKANKKNKKKKKDPSEI